MPHPLFPFGRLTATLAGLAGAGLAGAGLEAGFGGGAEGATPPGWNTLALFGMIGSAWALLRKPALGLPPLNLTLRPPPVSQTLEGVLRFASTAPLAWCARRGEWCLELDAAGPAGLPWRLDLRHAEWRQPAITLACAATFDAALTVSRRLHVTRQAEQATASPAMREAARLLNCDLEFTLPGPSQRITALAEGGYALHDETGCRALSPPTVDALLDKAGRLHKVG